MSTNRIALGDQLDARFNAQSYGGRFETGYRYATPLAAGVVGATPYAAGGRRKASIRRATAKSI